MEEQPFLAEVATQNNNESQEEPMFQGSKTVWGGGPTSPLKTPEMKLKAAPLQWHPNLLTMNGDNIVPAQFSLVILLMNAELPAA